MTGVGTDVPPESGEGTGRSYSEWLSNRRKATLELGDGTSVTGFSFGYEGPASGEVVFNTGMVGYPESLSDPSYAGQILVLTYPLVGNYGVAAEERDDLGLLKCFESDKIHVKALIVSEYSFTASHYTAKRTLGKWLKSQGVPGIYGVDTRALTKKIRNHGALLGKVIVNGCDGIDYDDPNHRNLAGEVGRKVVEVFNPPSGEVKVEGDAAVAAKAAASANAVKPPGSGPFHILAVDCGMKNNIIRYLVNVLRVKLTVVPWNYDFTKDEFDGLFLSNGPGDPTKCQVLIDHVKVVMKERPTTPIFGICMGNQILGLAAGGSTYKMKFGNRGMNQPCVDMRTTRCYITPQNHGFALDNDSLPKDWMPLMINANDGTNEGIVHCSRPWFSVQFHPEASGGPTDTAFLFTEFLKKIAEPTQTLVTTIPYSTPQTHRKVLVLGSGGLTIGQAGEFDYSGSQAIKALKERGVTSVVINPNIATIQTSWGLADKVYFLPVTVEFVTQVIKKERPDGIFCTFGGQTALNCAIKLKEEGILEQYNVKVLGTPISTIITTEDRELFAEAVAECGYKVAESKACENIEDAAAAAKEIGYPVLVRAAFALGGLGSGFAADEAELRRLAHTALVNSPQVMIDKSLKGWKELEYEVVRDANNNCITVCNMENFDPMGIHTGDSIVIAPSQTLTNDEYFRLRECAVRVVRHLGVVGECNIQYAVDPHSSEFRIIEVNARLSRSSALASKATGYPLAYVAAKLALGSDLVTLRNSVTRSTTACFEPSLDYIVAKVPRWDLRKFTTVDPAIGSCMKSVGEVMAIGRTFEEIIQKALRMVDESCGGFDSQRFDMEIGHRKTAGSTLDSVNEHVKQELMKPTPSRVFAIAKAFELGMKVEELHELTKIDRWFLSKLYHIHRLKEGLRSYSFEEFTEQMPLLKEVKRCGFADKQIAFELQPVVSVPDAGFGYTGGSVQESHVRLLRMSRGICPVVKQIDTLAAEFPAETNYLYLTYSGDEHDVSVTDDERRDIALAKLPLPPPPLGGQLSAPPSPRIADKDVPRIPDPLVLSQSRRPLAERDSETCSSASRVIVLGCGPYRIGSSVEFDWCGVSCVKTLRSLGHEAIIINCNPETVSTDFDESDRLYFEELSLETVLDIVELENPGGTIVSVGGQTPNNLAMALHQNNVKILGTSVEAIDACEDRFKFSQLCDSLRIEQPRWSNFTTIEEAFHFCRRVGYPTLVRPSYVLSGAAMRVVSSDAELERFLKTACIVSPLHPVVISQYIQGAKEVELDAVGQNGELLNYAIAEHVENAGVHSGDASLLLPAQKLFVETHRRVKQMGQKICRALKISGPFNIQFICKENDVKVIECNLRASRSMPFISKTYNVNFIELATRVMLGMPQRRVMITPIDLDYIGCKLSMFSFQRLQGSDPRLGVEMQSTGEVACFGVNMYEAFMKGLIASGFRIPEKNILVSIGQESQRLEFIQSMEKLVAMGYQVYVTKGTHEQYSLLPALKNIQVINKPSIKKEPNALTMIRDSKIDLTICVPSSMDSHGVSNGYLMRRATVDSNKPLISDLKTAILAVQSLHHKWQREQQGKPFYSYLSWQEYTALTKIGAPIAQ